MGIRTQAFFEVRTRDDLARRIDAAMHCSGVVEALRAVRFDGEGAGITSLGRVEDHGRLVCVRMPARWRGFVSMPELREPFRAAIYALHHALGAQGHVVYCHDDSALPSHIDTLDDEARASSRPLELFTQFAQRLAAREPERLSRAFRGWNVDGGGAYLETFADMDAADPLATLRRTVAARSELFAACARDAMRGRQSAAHLPTVCALVGRALDVALIDDPSGKDDVAQRLPPDTRAVLVRDCRHLVFEPGAVPPVDLLFESSTRALGDAGVVATREGRFDALTWSGVIVGELDGERVVRWVLDDGDLEGGPVLEAVDEKLARHHEATPRGLMFVLEAIVRRRARSGARLTFRSRVSRACPAGRMRVPGAITDLVRRANLQLEVSHAALPDGETSWAFPETRAS